MATLKHKPLNREAKSSRPISLTSCLLKGMTRLIEQHVRDGIIYHHLYSKITQTSMNKSKHHSEYAFNEEMALQHDI